MFSNILLKFVHHFSFLQQYLIIVAICVGLLFYIHYIWCIFFLPLSTILAYHLVKYLAQEHRSPMTLSGRLFDLYLRTRTSKSKTDHGASTYENSIQKECDIYVRTIIARYICVWYYPYISTDQEFLEDVTILCNIILNRFNDRLKSLNTYEIARRILKLKRAHMKDYLTVYDSCRRQQGAPNRISKSMIVEEFGRHIRFHPCLTRNDLHAFLKSIVELFLTDLLPESFNIYASSRAGRELITQLITNAIFLPLFQKLSQPKMIFYLIVLLWESDEQRELYEKQENVSEEIPFDSNRTEQDRCPEESADQIENEPKLVEQIRPERIIYWAKILSTDLAYNSSSGAPHTDYVIQCQTKSPFVSDAIHDYTVRRRFREFDNLHKRLQQNPMTSRHCYELDELFRRLPLTMDNLNPDVIRRRRAILEQYVDKLVSNDTLNSSHDVLEFFAFNSDPNKPFEALLGRQLSVLRFDRVLSRTFHEVGNRLISSFPSRREPTPLRERSQLHISTTYENTSTVMDQLKSFVQNTSLRCSPCSVTLNSVDYDFLKSLLTRPALVRTHRINAFDSQVDDLPLTDALLNLLQTSLHSREAIVSYQSVHQMLRTTFGHLIEKFLRNEIDDLLSRDKILTYLIDLRTKVLWPDENETRRPMKNIKRRALDACMKKIPLWLQHLVGVENVRQVFTNLFQCLSHEELNRHVLCQFLELLVEQLIPQIGTEEFLTRYVHMHTSVRS